MHYPAPAAPPRPGTVSRALARDRIGVRSVLSFMLAGIAPLTVAAGVITAAYATTGLTGIPAAFWVTGAVLALFVPGYAAMSRRIVNAGAFYAFITRALGRPAGVAAALVALLAYTLLQVGLYGALGPAMQAQAARYLHVSAPWWAWALGAWALVTVLGLVRVGVVTMVLGALTVVELAVVIIEAAFGLARPAAGQLSLAPLSPAALGSAGLGALGVLAVVAGLGFVGFEQAPVLGEEARSPRRTLPVATYLTLALTTVLYTGIAWAMAEHAGEPHVVAAAGAQGPGLLFAMAGSAVSQAGQLLFMTSLFAAALAFHNAVWRYTFALSREGVLPDFLSRTAANSIPRAASLAQSLTALAVIAVYAVGGWPPMTDLFFWLGTTGGFGILVLLAATCVAVITFFARQRGRDGESLWAGAIAPALSFTALAAVVVLAVMHYATLLGVPSGAVAAWALPASYGAVAVFGLAWALVMRRRRPAAYARIGRGPGAVTAPGVPASVRNWT